MIIYDIYNNNDIYMSHNSVQIKKYLTKACYSWSEQKEKNQ